jgi:uncharacterized damage-inducible protein DinB
MTTNASREHSTPSRETRGSADERTPRARGPFDDVRAPYASLMRYKRWADADLFETLLARPDIETEPHAEILREIIGHFHVVDRIFQAHLQGVSHAFTATRLQEAPGLTQLQDEVAAVDQWYVDYADSIGRDTLGEERAIRFTDGTEKTFTVADMLLHVSHHGAYHRGNAGVLLRMMSMELPADRFIDYVEALEPRG